MHAFLTSARAHSCVFLGAGPAPLAVAIGGYTVEPFVAGGGPEVHRLLSGCEVYDFDARVWRSHAVGPARAGPGACVVTPVGEADLPQLLVFGGASAEGTR
jgi:hypothetical protein